MPEPTSPDSSAPEAPQQANPAPQPEAEEQVGHGISPIEAARLATGGHGLQGRSWALPRLAASYDMLLLALVVVAGLLSYINSFSGEWVLDGRSLLLADPRIRDANHLEEIFNKNYGYPAITYDGLYRPLTTLSFWFNYYILGNATNPIGYHTVNWVLHIINSCLVFYLVSVVFRSTRAGFAAAMLFVCHPGNSEAVVHIMGRSDLLMTLLVLTGLFLHFGQVAYAGRRGLAALLRLSLWTVFLLGLLAKETAVVLLPLVMVFDWLYDWRRYTGRPSRDFWENALRKFRANYLGMLCVLLGYLGWRIAILMRLEPRHVAFVDNPAVETGFISRSLTSCKVILKSIYVLIFPRSLTADYGFNAFSAIDMNRHQLEDLFGIVALMLVAGVVFVAWYGRRRMRPVTFWIVMFILALLPCASLFAVSPTIFSERWLYLPSIALCALAGVVIHLITRTIISPWWAFKGQLPAFADVSEITLAQENQDPVYLHKLAVRGRIGWFLYGFIIALFAGVFGYQTYSHNGAWANELSLWRSAAIAAPDSAKVQKHLAWATYQSAPNGSRIDESIAAAEKAILILPDYDEAYAHLGHYYGIKADLAAARERAASKQVSPETHALYMKAAETLQKAATLDRRSSDERLLRLRTREWARSVKLQLGNSLIYMDLGTVYGQLQRFAPSADAFKQAVRLSPTEPDAHEGVGEALANLGKLDESAVHLLQALLLDPNRTRPWQALTVVYQKLSPSEQPITRNAQGKFNLNTKLKIVQGHIDKAFHQLVQSLLDANQRDAARQIAEIGVDQYGLPIADFGDLVKRSIQREKVFEFR